MTCAANQASRFRRVVPEILTEIEQLASATLSGLDRR